MNALWTERPGMTAEQIRRLRALADAYVEVTNAERVRISPTQSVPARLFHSAS